MLTEFPGSGVGMQRGELLMCQTVTGRGRALLASTAPPQRAAGQGNTAGQRMAGTGKGMGKGATRKH